jgi:cyclin G2
MSQLDKYNGECTVAHRQRLVWKLSNRTLRHLRPTDKLRATLPTIKESSNLQRMR